MYEPEFKPELPDETKQLRKGMYIINPFANDEILKYLEKGGRLPERPKVKDAEIN